MPCNRTSSTLTVQPLALLGGPRVIDRVDESLFQWPIVTEEDEQAVLEVLRARTMSGVDVTREFEKEYAAYQGTKYALGYPNGTMSLLAGMYAAGVGRGDEIIVPSITYWASAMPAYALGATPVFADIDLDTLCIDPADIERHLSERTKAIVPVHYAGYPCDLDAVMAIARKHNLKVIEDISHAHGGQYKGRMVGSFGDVSCMSMMSGKSLAIGEAGMICTNDRQIYERAAAFGNYARHQEILTIDELKQNAGIPLGGVKGRMNQTCAAMGRVQLKHYPQRMAEIQKAMNRFWDLLEDVPGLRAHRTDPDSDSTMGGWYSAVGLYEPDPLGGLPVTRFIEAVIAEGVTGVASGCNFALHLHPVMNTADIYGDGKPTRIAFSARDVRQPAGSLPNAEVTQQRTFGVPCFKHDRPAAIEQYAAVYRKVAGQAEQLLSSSDHSDRR